MGISKNLWLKSLALSITAVLPASFLNGCSMESSDPASEQVSESAESLGIAVPTCSTAASSGYNVTTSNLALTMNTPNVVIGVVGGFITVNGYTCLKPTAAGGVKLLPSAVKKITITGTVAAEKVVVDMLSGSFGPSILGATGGIVVDLVSGTDAFSLRGTAGADKVTAGESGGVTYYEVSGDTVADIKVIAADSTAISLSGGNDIFNGRGGAFTASHLVASGTITSLTALGAANAVTVNGGDGDDVITGGDGDDALSGGAGNDTFKTNTGATDDGDDTIVGGAGTDTVDYSTRTAALTIVMDGATTGGQTGEADVVGGDVENLIGGSGNDTLSGNDQPNSIKGGSGNDILWGGPAGNCVTDVDTLDGEAGNDTFVTTLASDCGDTLIGGAGTDRADYQLRTAALTITIDGAANDGITNEKDNVKTDVEIVLGGDGADSITGSPAADELHGGPGIDTINAGAGDDTLVGDAGADTLNGEAGDDTFDDGDVDGEYASGTELKGAGGDIMNGGTGFDTVDYSERANPVTVTICVDPAKITGATSLVTAVCTDSDGESEGDKIVNVNHVIGGADDDTLTGGTGADTLEGGPGVDTINGGAGDDALYGDAGADILNGNAGDDTLDGGLGADVLNGDTGGSNLSDADVCFDDGADTLTNCDL